MTAVTLPQPAPPMGPTDEDVIHLWCCDPDRSLCGIELTDDVTGDVPPGDEICVVCRVIHDSDLPCGAQGCSEGRTAP